MAGLDGLIPSKKPPAEQLVNPRDFAHVTMAKPDWRTDPDHQERLIGIGTELRRVLQIELKKAETQKKIPVILIGEDHLAKISYLTEAVALRTLHDLQQTSASPKPIFYVHEGAVDVEKIFTPEEYAAIPQMQHSLQNQEQLFAQGQSGIGWFALADDLGKKNIIKGVLPLDDYNNSVVADGAHVAYQLYNGDLAGERSFNSTKATTSETYHPLETVGSAKIQKLFPGEPKILCGTVGAMHLKGLYDLLKKDGRFHVVAFNTMKIDKKMVDVLQLPQDSEGKRVIAHTLIPIGVVGDAAEGNTYKKGEPIAVDTAALEKKIDFLSSPEVTDLCIGLSVKQSYEKANQAAAQIVTIARERALTLPVNDKAPSGIQTTPPQNDKDNGIKRF